MLCFLCERYLPHKKHIMLGQIFLSMGGLDLQNCGVLIYQKHLIYHLAFIKKKRERSVLFGQPLYTGFMRLRFTLEKCYCEIMIWIAWHHFWQYSISEWKKKTPTCRQLSDKGKEFYIPFKIYCVLRLCMSYTTLEIRIDRTAINSWEGTI